MLDVSTFVFGCLCAALGGELFVHGLVGVAQMGRLPKGVVAATIGAFATSSPELAIGVTSALDGVPELSLGDAMGSNIVNVALVLAIPIVMFGLQVTRESARRDLPFALAIFPIICVAGSDGVISASDGLVLLLVFLAWLGVTLLWALRNRTEDDAGQPQGGRTLTLATAVVGLLMLFLAGQLIVAGGTGIAHALGLPAFVVGATIVALGTSVPELATVLVASWRGHQEVGLQTIWGSNIFNSIFVVPVAALIFPIKVGGPDLWLAAAFGFGVTLLTVPLFSLQLGRWRGWALLSAYASFVVAAAASAEHG